VISGAFIGKTRVKHERESRGQEIPILDITDSELLLYETKFKHGILSTPIVFLSEFGVKNGLMAYLNFNSLVSGMAKIQPVMRKPAVKYKNFSEY
jgi:hypothetical protein